MIWPLGVWATVTMLHFGLAARSARRLLPDDSTLDERVHAAALGGVASLAIVLHSLALTVGISLAAGVAGLAVWHGGWELWIRRTSRPLRPVHPPVTFAELLALMVWAGVVGAWTIAAVQSGDVLGPDAAHYHVPYAVNLAAGASPFSLPATPHLYPMAGSVVSAWFIAPTGDALLVDLAMVLPGVLLVSAMNLLFRAMTGLSGTSWASWLGLALFSTPMFRLSSLGAADLWFAAAFVSLTAIAAFAWGRREWRASDAILAGGALGLLLGSKTTGAPAAVLIVGAIVAIGVLRRFVDGAWFPWTGRRAASAVLGLSAAVLAGGVWLIRSWVQFGSPIAPAGLTIAGMTVFGGEPFQQTEYFSVLGEMATDSFHVWERARQFVGDWFGRWYLMALSPVLLFAIDTAASWRLRRGDERWWARAGVLAITVGVGAALIWMLIGAPWTALERSRGLTLRYALPIAALLPVVAFAGCFPMRARWYERMESRGAAALVVWGGGLWLFLAGARLPQWPVPPWSAIGLVIGIIATAFGVLASWRTFRLAVVVTVVTVAGLGWAWMADANHQRVLAGERARMFELESTYGAGVDPADSWQTVLLAVRSAERAEGRRCASQRFFSLTRFDEPLALQPPGFGNQVYYAGRDVASARQAGPLGPCDYVITTPALAATDKGQALAAALLAPSAPRVFARTNEMTILAAGRP